MLRHGIALVLLEAIARAILRQRAHQPVARHLGDDRGRRDRHHHAVAADDGIAVAGQREPVAAVDEDVLWHFRQRVHGARQRPQRGAQDIVAIDPRRRGKGDREGRRSRRSSRTAPRASRRSGAWNRRCPSGMRVGIEHDGGRHHRPRQRTAAGLVATRHRPDAALEQRALAPKVRRRHRDHAFRQLWPISRLGFLSGLVSNHAGIVRKRARRATGNFPMSRGFHRSQQRPVDCDQSGRCTRRSSPTSIPGATTTSQAWPSGSAK